MKQKFRVYKKTLPNGMNILVRPNNVIPEVSIQLWYDVGAKDEDVGERGMAHLIEHMIFKGTESLSETDIDLITVKLSGYANAFTSNDYTTYVFKLPSNVWHESLFILSDCMQNARFDEQMLNSELNTVVQELKMYKDDYQEVLIEHMMSGIFPQHPYQHPIIGYKQDLLSLKRDNLYNFYKKHYHPGNATLVITGDVKKDEALDYAEKAFAKIPVPEGYKKKEHFFIDDIYSLHVRLPREVETTWAFYSYVIPGITEEKAYIFDMIKLLLGRGRSSRLYGRLVNEEKLATDVGCFTYDLFDKGLFYIYVQPISSDSLPRIESIIDEEVRKLAGSEIEEWEFSSVKKKAEMGYYSLLESAERQAELIGHSFLATGDLGYLDNYMENIRKTKRSEIQRGIEDFLKSSLRHSGYIVPSDDQDKETWRELQKKSDELDIKILQGRERSTKVEGGSYVAKVEGKPLPEFKYPIPRSFILDNGLEVVYHNKPSVPKLSAVLGLKANYLYEPSELSGMSTLMSRLLLEGTKKYSSKELSQYLDSNGIYMSTGSGVISIEVLSKDLAKGLEAMHHIATEPSFKADSVEKVRRQMLVELDEFWDTPSVFVDSLARDVVYKNHPYSKSRLGHKESVKNFSREQIFDFHEKFVSPQDAILVIVGDLSEYDEKSLKRVVNKAFADWKGEQIPDIIFPEISYKEPKAIHHKINRDQVVLAFAAPSISRLDNNYDALSVLDFILTGGGISTSSRLYQLREQTGLFYTAGGSLVYGASKEPGMMLIKAIVSLDKVDEAEKLIRKTIKNLNENGISELELFVAANALMTASMRVFESNSKIASAFLFFKRCGMNLDLFDKRGALLSILKVGIVNNVARRYCKENLLSTIRVGRKSG